MGNTTRITRSQLLGYGVAVVSVALATGARGLLDPALGDRLPFLTFFAAVMITAAYGGLGPALAALVLGAVSAAYCFMSPRGSLLEQPEYQAGMVLYLFVGLVSILLTEWLRVAQRRVREQKRTGREKAKLLHDLGERVKELTALHGTARLLQNERLGTRQLLHELVHLLPAAWQYPEITAVRVAFTDLEVHSPNFAETPWRQRAEFATADGQRGFLEVVYLEEKPTEVEGPFLAEERNLINSLSEMLQIHFDRQQAEASRRRAYEELDRRIQERTAELAAANAGLRREIAERERLEEELRRRAQELAATDRRKDEFLATLGHELRNPLAPIRNAVQILRRPGPESTRQWAREVLERQVRQLSHLVDDLLDISRINHGKIKLRLETVSLADVVARAVEASRPLIEARQHQLEVVLPAEPVSLEADPTRLAQILSNLLNNAAKYTDKGGRIRLLAEKKADDVVLRVQDTGIGIAAELLPHIFDLFTQADRALDRSQGGLGIGLSLVRRLVELHGGTVQAWSEGPGKGSEFVVRLPLARASPRTALPATPAAVGNGCARPRRILIVDDNVDAAESLALILRGAGHEIRTAQDGLAALEVARDFRPEVVILDIGLPGIDGYEVARRLRQEPGLEKAVLVALTGYAQEGDQRRSRAAGFDHHLVKPVDLEALERLLAEPALAAQR